MSKYSGPNVWRPNRVLSVPQIDLSVCADRKMVNLHAYLRNITKKSRFYRADTQIKNIKIVFLWVPSSFECEEKKFPHRPMRICVSAYFLKKSQPQGHEIRSHLAREVEGWCGGVVEGRYGGDPFKLHAWGSNRMIVQPSSSPQRSRRILLNQPFISQLSKHVSLCHHGCYWFLIWEDQIGNVL